MERFARLTAAIPMVEELFFPNAVTLSLEGAVTSRETGEIWGRLNVHTDHYRLTFINQGADYANLDDEVEAEVSWKLDEVDVELNLHGLQTVELTGPEADLLLAHYSRQQWMNAASQEIDRLIAILEDATASGDKDQVVRIQYIGTMIWRLMEFAMRSSDASIWVQIRGESFEDTLPTLLVAAIQAGEDPFHLTSMMSEVHRRKAA